jgi:hypothetical protein
MGRQFRIRVYGQPRPHPDPALLAHIVILLGRHLHQQQEHHHQQGHGLRQHGGHQTADHAAAGETVPAPGRRRKPAQTKPGGHDTPPRTNDGDQAARGGGSS